jgi:hypothetical protein
MYPPPKERKECVTVCSCLGIWLATLSVICYKRWTACPGPESCSSIFSFPHFCKPHWIASWLGRARLLRNEHKFSGSAHIVLVDWSVRTCAYINNIISDNISFYRKLHLAGRYLGFLWFFFPRGELEPSRGGRTTPFTQDRSICFLCS